MSAKTTYHPLVVYFYLNGLLNPEQIKSFPLTTRQYWDKHEIEKMHGYDWVKDFSNDLEDIAKIQKNKIIYKAQKLCIKTLKCVATFFDKTDALKNLLRKNAEKVVETIDYLTTEMPLKKACKVFGILSNQYYRWKNKINCSASTLNLCFKTHPHQLTIAEVTVIKDAIQNPEYKLMRRVSIYYTLLNKGKLFCSLSTFYKYARLLFGKPEKKVNAPKKQQLQSTRVFEYLHIDTTIVSTDEGSKRVVFVKDNYSKYLLHKCIVSNGSSTWIADVLKNVFTKYDLHNYKEPINIVSDGGSENKGDVIDWINSLNKPNMVIKKTVGVDNFNYTNNEIESNFNIFKNEFARDKKFSNEDSLNKGLEDYECYYNTKRYPNDLFGLLPLQVFNGEIPDKRKFSKQINEQKKLRYQANKSAKFCDVCSVN